MCESLFSCSQEEESWRRLQLRSFRVLLRLAQLPLLPAMLRSRFLHVRRWYSFGLESSSSAMLRPVWRRRRGAPLFFSSMQGLIGNAQTHCVKCGLTLDEAQALNEARRDELAGHGMMEAGHFTGKGDATDLKIPRGVALPPSPQPRMSPHPRPVSQPPRPMSQHPH